MKLLTKPESWQHLPSRILNSFLWNLDLEYDHYESSKAEAVHNIECGCDYGNEKIVNSAWAMVSPETYSQWIADEIQSLKNQITHLENLN
jgi:hypothetical protein